MTAAGTVAPDVTTGAVFVVGPPGSGTAAVHAGLSAHPALWGGGIGEFLAPLFVRLPGVYADGTSRGRLQWLSAQQVSFAELVRHVGRSFGALYAERAGTRRWVDHSPVYGRMLDSLALAFPSASVVWVNRDGREVVSLAGRHPNVDDGLACRMWSRYAEAWRRAAASGLRLLEVRHDRLAVDPEGQMARILDFLGEADAPSAVAALRAALDAEAPADWRRWSATERRSFDEVAGPALRALGYAADSSWVHDGG